MRPGAAAVSRDQPVLPPALTELYGDRNDLDRRPAQIIRDVLAQPTAVVARARAERDDARDAALWVLRHAAPTVLGHHAAAAAQLASAMGADRRAALHTLVEEDYRLAEPLSAEAAEARVRLRHVRELLVGATLA